MKRPRGFTLIEVLTAISVIAILAAMLFLGARFMTNSAKKGTTVTMLGNLKSMITNREASGLGATKVRTELDGLYATATTACDAQAISSVEKGFTAQRYPTAAYLITVPSVPVGENAVGVTQYAMALLTAVPVNKSILGNLPQQQFLEKQVATDNAFNPPILLDGYGNPMILVPSTGLANVYLSGSNTPVTIRSPDGKPFFAAAGPDGNFSYIDVNHNGTFDPGIDQPAGDDNVYSFEN